LTSAKSTLIRPGVVIGDALDAVQQDLVGAAERVHQRDCGVAHLEQPVVRDHDEGVAALAQCGDAGLGLIGTALALE
jgi:hypothetical protein